MSLRLQSFCLIGSYDGEHMWSVLSSHFVSRQYVKYDLMDSIRIWHVDVPCPQSVPYFEVSQNY